jgi:nicotinate-nucleotide adenylyltransferase
VPEAPHTLIFFGGTFDPPHLGHVAAIRELRRQTRLPVTVVPTGVPSYRPSPQASAMARAEMVELAVGTLADPLVTVCRREVDQDQPCATVETVEWLRSRHPELKVVLALGSDAAADLPSWQAVRRLLAQVSLLVFQRAGTGEPGEAVLAALGRRRLPLVGAQVISLSTPAVDATGIRERIAKGASCVELLPDGVGEYIRSHHLYRQAPDSDR